MSSASSPLRSVLVATALGLGLVVGAPSGAAGPTIPCAASGGPDPLRFRPEAAVTGADVVAPSGAARLALAAAEDASTGAAWVALAWVDPAGAVQLLGSVDGSCTFDAIPVAELGPGPAEGAPALALRGDDTGWWLGAGWRAGGRLLLRTSDLPGTFADVADLDAATAGPALALTPAPAAARLAAAWVAPDGTLRVASTVALDDPAAWTAPVDVATGLPPDARLALAADAEGVGATEGFTLAWTDSGGAVLVARSNDGGASFEAARRVDDGSAVPTGALAAHAAPDASVGAWSLLAWSGQVGADAAAIVADAARHESGVLAFDFDGAAGAGNVVLEPAAAAGAAPALAGVAGGPVHVIWSQGGEVRAAVRAPADVRPNLADGCGPVQLTGLDPLRAGGSTASEPAAAALGADLVLAWIDDRGGAPSAWIKRADSVPPPAGPVTLTPADCGDPPALTLDWPAPACDVVDQVVEVGLSPGATDFTLVAAPDATSLLVEGLDPATTYHVRLRVADAAGHETVSDEVAGDTAGCSEAWLEVELVGFGDACPFGGAGGDGDLDPGETGTVQLLVRNRGTVAAPAARVRLRSRSPALHVVDGWVDLGDLGPDATAMADVTVDLDAGAPCGDAVIVLAESDADDARWGDLLDLGPPLGCTPCVGACAATASASVPAETCRGTAVTLDASASLATGCAGRLLYEWWEDDQLVGSSVTLDRSPNDSVTYRLVVRCSTELDCSAEDSADLVVHPRPSIGFFEDPPPPHCEGDLVVLRASTSDPAATFAWDGGEAGDAIDVTAGGLYRVTVTDSNGCQRSRSWRVDFAPPPLADAGPAPAGCAPQRIGTPPLPLLDYSWDPPTGLSSPTEAQPLAAPASPTTYTLTVTDPLSGCSATDAVDVDLDPPPSRVGGLRVGRAGTDLVYSWAAAGDAVAVRIYREDLVERARQASGSSPSASLSCEGAATTCTAPAPATALTFFQAVTLCSDGVTEGPN